MRLNKGVKKQRQRRGGRRKGEKERARERVVTLPAPEVVRVLNFSRTSVAICRCYAWAQITQNVTQGAQDFNTHTHTTHTWHTHTLIARTHTHNAKLLVSFARVYENVNWDRKMRLVSVFNLIIYAVYECVYKCQCVCACWSVCGCGYVWVCLLIYNTLRPDLAQGKLCIFNKMFFNGKTLPFCRR